MLYANCATPVGLIRVKSYGFFWSVYNYYIFLRRFKNHDEFINMMFHQETRM